MNKMMKRSLQASTYHSLCGFCSKNKSSKENITKTDCITCKMNYIEQAISDKNAITFVRYMI